MEELVYYTSRTLGEGGVTVWVFKQQCPSCGKALMGKPKNKDGKVKVRAKEYVCPECGYSVAKAEYQETLTANVEYTCPQCKHHAETQLPFKRKRIKGVLTLRVACENCGAPIDVTKKFKKPKKK